MRSDGMASMTSIKVNSLKMMVMVWFGVPVGFHTTVEVDSVSV
jgi:hypothetical protein